MAFTYFCTSMTYRTSLNLFHCSDVIGQETRDALREEATCCLIIFLSNTAFTLHKTERVS